ncbi:MAG: class I adenylate-forming enzyme family protein, partial [Acidimicrobiales bacterium]
MLVGDVCRRNGRRYGTKPAVVFEGSELTWAALDERANRLGTYLLGTGLRSGDRVAVLARNTAEWPEIMFGLAKAGLVLVPVNVRLAPGEAAYILEDSGSRAAIVHGDHVDDFGDVLATLDSVVQIGASTLGASTLGTDYETALREGRDVDPTPGTLTPADIQFLLYTSGTTGRPKAVVNEHRGMLAQAFDTSIVTEASHEDVMLAITPFFTAGGMVRTLSWLFLGQTMVIHPRFDPEHVVADIERRHVSMTTFIPTMLMRTLSHLEGGPARDLSSLRRISYGSAPVPPGLAMEAMDRLGCDLQQRYGLTEAGGQVTILTPADHRAIVAGKIHLLESCGRETPQSEIRIVDDDGEELPSGEIGEVVVRAESLARGYWNRPEETAATFRPTGLWSGDLGRLDDERYLSIVGRKTDMIISGGFNVYPAELERVIGGDPDVDLVAVVGAPHDEWGETPVAVVVPKRADVDVSALEERLRQLCRDELAGYKQPRAFEFRSELPQTPA